MSIKLMTAIWDNDDPGLSGSKLIVLLCLADHANDDGLCWPSLARIAARARLDVSNITRHIKELAAEGYLTITRTPGKVNMYRISPRASAIVPPAPAQGHPPRQRNSTPRASAIVPPAPAQYTPRGGAGGPPAVARGESSLTINQPSWEASGEPSGATPAIPPPLATDSATAGWQMAETLTDLNGQVAAELRRPIVEALLDITGKRALADAGGDEGDRLLLLAHQTAIVLWRMGCKTDADLLRLEPEWAADWRGRNGGTFKQLLEFVSERLAGKTGRRNGSREHPGIAAVRLVQAEEQHGDQ